MEPQNLEPQNLEPQNLEPSESDTAHIAVPTPSRSLAVVGFPAQRWRVSIRLSRPSAPFLAQLVAGAQRAPQTRVRRQAEPAEAALRYLAAAPMPSGQKLRTTM